MNVFKLPQTLTGTTIPVEADSAAVLRDKIEVLTGIPREDQRLLLHGKHEDVADGNLLSYGVPEACTVHVDFALRGGSSDAAFMELGILRRCMHRVHRFSPGIAGRFLLEDGDRSSSLGHWSLIVGRHVQVDSVSPSSLHAACRAGQSKAIESLVHHYGLGVNSVGIGGWTALHTAVVHFQVKVVRQLLDSGATEMATSDGVLPSSLHPRLWAAVRSAGTPVLDSTRPNDVLVPKIADPTISTRSLCHSAMEKLDALRRAAQLAAVDESAACTQLGDSFLAAAARFGRPSLCRVCVELGAAVGGRGGIHSIPLIAACREGHVECARILVEYGADVNTTDRFGRTPIWTACQRGKVDCARFLIDHGADVHKVSSGGSSPFQIACQEGNTDCVRFLLDLGVDARGNGTSVSLPPLYRACAYGHAECAALLLERGALETATDSRGATPLHAACEKGHTDCARILIDHGAEVNTRMHDGATPLALACQNGRSDCARLLLRRGADVTMANNAGFTPLEFACVKSHGGCLEALLGHGADVNEAIAGGSSPLHLVTTIGDSDIVRMLLNHDANVNQTADDGSTPLHGACKGNHVDCARLLLLRGAAVDHRDHIGATPLSVACSYGSMDCVRLLLGVGASVDKAREDGRTPLHMACTLNRRACALLLLEHGASATLLCLDGVPPAEYARACGARDPELALAVDLAASDRPAGIAMLRDLPR